METALNRDIRVFPDSDALAAAAAAFFADSATEAIGNRGRFSVALSGGATPRKLFRLLGLEYRDRLRWGSIHLFWADERSVPPDHEQSNYRLAYDELISKISMPSGNIHRIQGELDPAEAAREYEKTMHGHFGSEGIPVFDLILLGLGKDGHTASLFPGSEALLKEDHLAVPSYSGSTGDRRVTLTLPVLNNAADIIFLVSGRSKAGIVSEILMQGKADLYPAGLVHPPAGDVMWFMDKEAASGL